MEFSKKRKAWEIIKNIVFFLVLFCAFLGLYYSPFSYFNDSYGLSMGPKTNIIMEDFSGILDFVYIKSINFLYLFLGEKIEVMIGYHIFVRMINCLLLFCTIKLTEKQKTAFVITVLYSIYPFLLHDWYRLDGILIGELFILFFVFIIGCMIKAITMKKRQGNTLLTTKAPLMVDEQKSNKSQIEETFGKAQEGEKPMEGNENLNFLEISDEEIRRNAMIAAGLLPAEETKKHAEKEEMKKQSEKEETKKQAEKEVAVPQQHTQFIENPLPVPKKHVKKEMDYEFLVPEDKMHYDIEEPDKNYFDIV